MEVIRKRLSPDELYNPRITYNSDDDTIYYTPPGGSTPILAPDFDPRHTGIIPLEPSGSLACDSAATMTAMLKMLVDAMIIQLYDGRDATLLVTGIIALLVAFGWVSLFIAIITALVAAALEAGAEALEAAFTETEWDTLNCIFYCHMTTSGQITSDSLILVRADVDSQIGGIAAVILNYYFDTLGEAGLCNASTVMGGLVTGDCAACECQWCYEGDNTVDMVSDGWTLDINLPASKYWTYTPATITISEVHTGWSSSGDSGSGSSAFSLWKDDIYDGDHLITVVSPLNSANPQVWSSMTPVVCGQFVVGVNTPDGTTELTSLLIVGIGARPDWTHGTEC